MQAHYPDRVPQGRARASSSRVALFGFKDEQNLFLTEQGWDAHYMPLMIERQPFCIGQSPNGEPMMHIDLDSPRVSRTEGEPLFREHGGNTEFLERMNSVLLAPSTRASLATQPFVAALLEHDLLESFVLDIELDDGSQNRFAGFYTMQRGAPGQARRRGAGHAAPSRATCRPSIMVVASLSQFPRAHRARQPVAMPRDG